MSAIVVYGCQELLHALSRDILNGFHFSRDLELMRKQLDFFISTLIYDLSRYIWVNIKDNLNYVLHLTITVMSPRMSVTQTFIWMWDISNFDKNQIAHLLPFTDMSPIGRSEETPIVGHVWVILCHEIRPWLLFVQSECS